MNEDNIKRILITGGKGQLGRALQRALTGNELIIADLPELDITDRPGINTLLAAARPGLVIHCAAYTDVDGCARDPQLAHRVNALGTQNVALACRQTGAAMLHISTNEVFAGDNPAGYAEYAPLNPINPYGHSKALAEHHVRSLVPRHYIVRLAWLFAPGGRNFIHTILRLARQNGQLRVVADEIGNPTYSEDLAQALSQLIHTGQYGTYHLTNSGACSRWAFANEILRQAGLDHVPNTPILSRDFPRPSTPPPYGTLHNNSAAALGITLRPWPAALADFLRHDAQDTKQGS